MKRVQTYSEFCTFKRNNKINKQIKMRSLNKEQNKTRNAELLQPADRVADIVSLENLLDSSFTEEEFKVLTDLLAGNSRSPGSDAQSLSQSILERSNSTALRLNGLIQHSRKSAIEILRVLGEDYQLPHNLALEIKVLGHESTPIRYYSIDERDVYSNEVHRMRYAIRVLQSMNPRDIPISIRQNYDFQSFRPEDVEKLIVSSSLVAKFDSGIPFYDANGNVIAMIKKVSAREKRGDRTADKYLETKTKEGGRNLNDYMGVQIEVARADQIEGLRETLLGRMGVRINPSLEDNYLENPKHDYVEAVHTYPHFPGSGFEFPIELRIRSTRSLKHEEANDPHQSYRERKTGERRSLWRGIYANVRIIKGAIAEVLKTAQNSFIPTDTQMIASLQGNYILSNEGPRAAMPFLVLPYQGSRSN